MGRNGALPRRLRGAQTALSTYRHVRPRGTNAGRGTKVIPRVRLSFHPLYTPILLTHHSRIHATPHPHILTLYRDKSTLTTRLSATIASGPLKRSPLWTAFIHADSLKPSFVKRQARRVLVRRLDLNVYSDEFERERWTTAAGHFVLGFVEESGELSPVSCLEAEEMDTC